MATKISDTVNLRALEVFDELARTGSMQEAASRLNMSAPAASQQLKQLESELGRELVVHNRRPMELTRNGHAYLVHVRAALQHLRQGASQLLLDELGTIHSLRIGIIDDFDGEVSPQLAVKIADTFMPAKLTLSTATSVRILQQVAEHTIDIGIAATPIEVCAGVAEIPLLHDPFVLAIPRGFLSVPPDNLEPLKNLPFLRYEKTLALGRQIDTHLARLRLAPEGKMELDSNQAIFGLIANGNGWTISTMVGYLRARRFHDRVDIHRLPITAFSRTISLHYNSELTPRIANIIAENLRGILQFTIVEPGHSRAPWLADTLTIVHE